MAKSKQPRNYAALLRLIHRRLGPRTYVEIGVGTGRSLALARPETLCVGIDPAPSLRRELPDSATIFELTSDEFFAEHDLRDALRVQSVDFAFIDGMHLFEFALRDFINLERVSGTSSVIAIHDCHPPSAEVAARERRTEAWSGDVWKLVPCLRKYRPDLQVAVVDVPPSGLGIVTDLDPASRVLEERYAEICREFIGQHYGDSEREQLSVVPGSWDLVRGMLPARERPRHRVRRAAAARRGRAVSAADSPAHTLRVGGATSAEITLYGYPESLLEEVVQAAASLQVRSDVPAIDRLRNLIFFPKLSALYDEDGRRVLETCVLRGPGLKAVPHPAPEEVAIPPRARRVDYPVIYCGRLRAHWGHFLTESISRLWPLPDADVPADAALLFQRAKRRAAYVVDRFFRYAGVDRGRLLELDSVTKLSDVFVPHPSFALEAEAFRCHAGLPERVAEAIGDGGRPSSDQPVYLSRRLITSPGGRRIVGEEELEDLLRRRGVMIVSPETLSYEDQVRLFNRHSTFIGCVGSAFHSLLYAPSGRSRRTVVIVPNALSHYERGSCYVDYFLTDALKGTRSSYLFDPVDSDEPSAETTLNAGATAAFLERLSLI